VYDGESFPDHKITNQYPRMPSSDEERFPKVTYIKVLIGIDPKIYVSNAQWNAVLNNFLKYLKKKCPNLEKPIQLNVKKTEYWTRYHLNAIFESK